MAGVLEANGPVVLGEEFLSPPIRIAPDLLGELEEELEDTFLSDIGDMYYKISIDTLK